jgi:rhodanese-related sulfurtransferase
MEKLVILLATAALLALGGCGPDVEESADTPSSAVEKPTVPTSSAVEKPAVPPKPAATRRAIPPISAAKLADRIQAGSPPLILDVRRSEAFAQGHIPGAINISQGEVPSRLAEFPDAKSEEIVVYDDSGRGAARLAEETLHGSGYTNVLILTGHWQGWRAAGLPTE